MTFLAANWGWFVLAALVFTVPAVVLGIRGFFRTAVSMPKALGEMTETMADALEDDEEKDPTAIAGAGIKGFFKGAFGFFGGFFKNMLPTILFGLASVCSWILAGIGFIGWLLQR